MVSYSIYIGENFHKQFPLELLGGYFVCSERVPSQAMCDRIIHLIIESLCERFEIAPDRLCSKAGSALVRRIKEIAAFLMVLFRIPNQIIAEVCDRCTAWVFKSYKLVSKGLVNQANIRNLICNKYETIRREIESV